MVEFRDADRLHVFASNARLAGKDVEVFVDPARPAHQLVDLTPYFGDDELG